MYRRYQCKAWVIGGARARGNIVPDKKVLWLRCKENRIPWPRGFSLFINWRELFSWLLFTYIAGEKYSRSFFGFLTPFNNSSLQLQATRALALEKLAPLLNIYANDSVLDYTGLMKPRVGNRLDIQPQCNCWETSQLAFQCIASWVQANVFILHWFIQFQWMCQRTCKAFSYSWASRLSSWSRGSNGSLRLT
jgi:hypothetical protein